jgi:hypothetical protein
VHNHALHSQLLRVHLRGSEGNRECTVSCPQPHAGSLSILVAEVLDECVAEEGSIQACITMVELERRAERRELVRSCTSQRRHQLPATDSGRVAPGIAKQNRNAVFAVPADHSGRLRHEKGMGRGGSETFT